MDIKNSQEQIAYEQALQSWQAMTQLALEKGVSFDQPQPLPEQFGYNPAGNAPNAGNTTQGAQSGTRNPQDIG